MESERLVGSAEVFRETLHRNTAIGRGDAIQQAFDVMPAALDEIFAVEMAHVDRAKESILARERLSARDALPVAIDTASRGS